MRLLSTALLLITSYTAAADQSLIANTHEADEMFWRQLYPGKGWTLYCGDYFESRTRVSIERIYPLSWAVRALKCSDIEQCRHTSARFNRIAADLHNLYPARPMIIRARNDFEYGIIPGEFREYFECDFESSTRDQLVEPRALARGNIARALFYMHTQYGLPLGGEMLKHLKQWNLADPPSKDEFRRNNLIEILQGTRNAFIDNPEMAHALLENSITTTSQRENDIQFLESF